MILSTLCAIASASRSAAFSASRSAHRGPHQLTDEIISFDLVETGLLSEPAADDEATPVWRHWMFHDS
ncbi:hypothetical protein WN73_06885 [Bradyrhizobium sp. CCBAU 45394]|nr:hypothetical protein [Bradyrhizobium sp. CCBAU 45394]